MCMNRWSDVIHVGVVGAGLLSVSFGLPAAVAVDELRQVGRFLGVAGDELVLQKLFSCGSLWKEGTTVSSITLSNNLFMYSTVKKS